MKDNGFRGLLVDDSEKSRVILMESLTTKTLRSEKAPRKPRRGYGNFPAISRL